MLNLNNVLTQYQKLFYTLRTMTDKDKAADFVVTNLFIPLVNTAIASIREHPNAFKDATTQEIIIIIIISLKKQMIEDSMDIDYTFSIVFELCEKYAIDKEYCKEFLNVLECLSGYYASLSDTSLVDCDDDFIQ